MEPSRIELTHRGFKREFITELGIGTGNTRKFNEPPSVYRVSQKREMQ